MEKSDWGIVLSINYTDPSNYSYPFKNRDMSYMIVNKYNLTYDIHMFYQELILNYSKYGEKVRNLI
jgi:hypothetical protein